MYIYTNMNICKKSIEIVSPLYQRYTTNGILEHKLKSEPSYGGQVVHPRNQTPQADSVVKPGALSLLYLF